MQKTLPRTILAQAAMIWKGHKTQGGHTHKLLRLTLQCRQLQLVANSNYFQHDSKIIILDQLQRNAQNLKKLSLTSPH